MIKFAIVTEYETWLTAQQAITTGNRSGCNYTPLVCRPILKFQRLYDDHELILLDCSIPMSLSAARWTVQCRCNGN